MIGAIVAGGLSAPTAPVTNSYESISTSTLGSSQSSVTINSIPSNYKHLQLRVFANATGTGGGFPDALIQFNSDATATNYAGHVLGGDGSSAYASSAIGVTFTGAYIGDMRDSTTPVSPTAKVIDILDYTSTNKNKTVRTLSGWDANGSGQLRFVSGLWMNSSTAISSLTITIRNGSNNLAAGSTFALYGIKG